MVSNFFCIVGHDFVLQFADMCVLRLYAYFDFKKFVYSNALLEEHEQSCCLV